MGKKYLALLLFSCTFLYSCGSGSTDKIQIDGSSTVYPITEAVAEEFRAKTPDVRVTVGVSGTGGGFQQFVQGDTDINDASRNIQPSEAKKAKKNDIEYARFSVAYDGLAVVINAQNDWVDYLTLEELEKIWQPSAQNKVTRWSDIRKEWPDEELTLFGPGVASGTYDYFTKVIVGESGASRGDFTSSEDDNVLVQGVSSDKSALGFFGLAYYEENKKRLKLVPIKNKAGEIVKPSLKTVSNNTYTPLSRPLYIYVRKEAAQKEHVQKFVNFYLDNAPELAKQVGYVPMPDSAYQAQREKFKEFYMKADSTAQAETVSK